MKKYVFCVIILMAVLLSVNIGCAETGSVDGIPQKVADILADKGIARQYLEDYVILDQVEAPSCLSHLFVLASTDGTHHTVYHFTNSESDEDFNLYWEYKTSYDSLAPQGKGSVCFYRHEHYDRYGENGNVQLYDNPDGFMIYRINPQNPEEYIQGVNVHVIDKTFQIVAWFDKNVLPVCSAYIKNGKLHYGNNETGKSYGTVTLYRTLDLNVSFSSLPKTYKQAAQKYTSPAELPAGKLKADLIKFTSNKKYAVYSAPDKKSYRSAKGKAAVSTNDWIQVFGQEDDWILIQYAINNEHYRFGYISAKSLPGKATVRQLQFDRITVYTNKAISITDDPLYSQESVISLTEGCAVTWMASMGEWAYVEYRDNHAAQWIRGFLPTSGLRMLNNEQACSVAEDALLSSNPVTESVAVAREMLQGYSINVAYDPETGIWSVRFDADINSGYTVLVDDTTGKAWVEPADNDR